MGLLSQHLEKPNCEGGTHRPGLHLLREAGDVRRLQLPPLGEPGSQTPTGMPAKPQGAPFVDRMLLLWPQSKIFTPTSQIHVIFSLENFTDNYLAALPSSLPKLLLPLYWIRCLGPGNRFVQIPYLKWMQPFILPSIFIIHDYKSHESAMLWDDPESATAGPGKGRPDMPRPPASLCRSLQPGSLGGWGGWAVLGRQEDAPQTEEGGKRFLIYLQTVGHTKLHGTVAPLVWPISSPPAPLQSEDRVRLWRQNWAEDTAVLLWTSHRLFLLSKFKKSAQ